MSDLPFGCTLCGMQASRCVILIGTVRGLVCSGCVGVLVDLAFESLAGQGLFTDPTTLFVPGQGAFAGSSSWGIA